MTAAELARVKAARDRNRAAMAQERAEAEHRRAAEAAATAEAERAGHTGMVQAVDLITRMPGRPLTRGQLARLQEIRLRHEILAVVGALLKENGR